MRGSPGAQLLRLTVLIFCGVAPMPAQDDSTGAIRGTIEDASGARIAGAQVVASNEANGIRHLLHPHPSDLFLRPRHRQRRQQLQLHPRQHQVPRPTDLSQLSRPPGKLRPSCKHLHSATDILSRLTSDVSAFAPNYSTPEVQQSSLSIEKELARRTSGTISFLHVHGLHLIRARDVNLPPPTEVQYPVFDPTGINLLGYGQVDTFSTWQLTQSFTCLKPPCINPLARPIPQLASINQFETEASSQYNGLTVSLQRRLADGFYFRLGYTWAHAVDTGPDALIAGQPAGVQNSYATASEKASSVTDQRHRFVFSMVAEPNPFAVGQPTLAQIFNHWKFAAVITFGSGRPYDAKVDGDPNEDGNSLNDRLPGLRRNALVGPAYRTIDSRFSRSFRVTNNLHLSLLIEAFNLFNHLNQRVLVDDTGFQTNAAPFVPFSQRVGATYDPAQYRRTVSPHAATGAYAPRQVQVAIRAIF